LIAVIAGLLVYFSSGGIEDDDSVTAVQAAQYEALSDTHAHF
jgi:hypothetical protein